MAQLKYRLLWTYAEWICGGKKAHYLPAFRQLIDSMQCCGLNGLIVWGLLDDDLGGAGPARELCRYANAHGVRILPGVGLGSYGGIWFHGRHRYNVETCVAAHPGLGAKFARGTPFEVLLPQGVPRGVMCMSQAATLRWLADGVRWLCREFPIGGINFESGDNGLCVCPACLRRAKEKKEARHGFSFADMGVFLKQFSELAHAVNPKLWLTSGIYTDYWRPPAAALAPLRELPPYAITQWNVAYAGQPFRPTRKLAGMFGNPQAGYAKYNGSTHLRRLYTPVYPNYSWWGFHPFLQSIRQFCRTAAREQLEGVCLTGSGLATMPDNELNYLALGYFAQHPERSLARFAAEVLAPIYGPKAAPHLAKLLLAVERINPKVGAYLYWILPLFGNATGGQFRESWGYLDKVRRRTAVLQRDWQRCGQLLQESGARLEAVRKLAPVAAQSRLRRIAERLAGERYLFQEFFPRCLPLYREYHQLNKHGTVAR